jgi:serine protease inhibitor
MVFVLVRKITPVQFNSFVMKNSYLLSLILTVVILTASCKKQSEEPLAIEPVPIQLSAQQAELVDSGNSFAFDIFRNVAEAEQEGKNLMISPLSISVALSMTLNGAVGTTREAILEALRNKGMTADDVNKAYKYLTEALLSVDKRVLISIANSVWTEQNFQAKKQFTDILTEYYKAEARIFDVTDPGVPDDVNAWIEDKTNGLIKDMLDQLDPDAVMLLINAIYFKGKWNSQFDAANTVSEPFYKAGGGTSSVSMMKQKNKFRVFSGTDFIMAEFPYGQGNYVMDVILPSDVNGLNNIIRDLNDESFRQMTEGLYENEVELSFPRFKYGYKKELKDILSMMGMGIAFSGAADFSGIADARLEISRVLHQAFIETNEEGTEAAAATIVEIRLTSMPSGPMVLRLDRPFMYVIRETTTNAILFMGRVSDPAVE